MRPVTFSCLACLAWLAADPAAAQCTPIVAPDTILGDWPASDVDWTLYVEPIAPGEFARFTGPPLVDTTGGDLFVRAWNYTASVPGLGVPGIVESRNVLRSDETALILVHPWGIEDGQGWGYPQAYNAYGYAFVGYLADNLLVLDHMDDLLKPWVDSVRGRLPVVAYSLPGGPDIVRGRLYRDYDSQPGAALRAQGQVQIEAYLHGLTGSQWPSMIPVHAGLDYAPDDVVIYDDLGFDALRDFLWAHGIKHVLHGGFATDMCVISTTAGYATLAESFDVFVVGTSTLAAWPATPEPSNGYQPHPTRDELIVASQHVGTHPVAVTQASWVRFAGPAPGAVHAPAWRGENETTLAWWNHWQAREAHDPLREFRRTPDDWKFRSYRDTPEARPYAELFDTGRVTLSGVHAGRVNVARIDAGRVLDLVLTDPASVNPYRELRLQVSWRPEPGQTLLAEYELDAGAPASFTLDERMLQENGWVLDVFSGVHAGAADTARVTLAVSSGIGYVDAVVLESRHERPPAPPSSRPRRVELPWNRPHNLR